MKVKLAKNHEHEGKAYEAGATIEIGDDPDRLAWLVEKGVVVAKAPARDQQAGNEEKVK